MGQTFHLVRGWGGKPAEMSSSCFLSRGDSVERWGLHTSSSKHHIVMLGCNLQV